MTLLKKELWTILLVLLLGLFLLASRAFGQTVSGPPMRDLDGDGTKETELIMSEGVIQKAAVDADLDGVPEMVILYRNGLRDLAVVDANQDGFIDTWVHFYGITGVPWKVAEDYNGDGLPDYWLYLRDGAVYRWEQDRNGDGRPDLRTLGDRQSLDDDFDGVFERPSRVQRSGALVPHGLRGPLIHLAKGGG